MDNLNNQAKPMRRIVPFSLIFLIVVLSQSALAQNPYIHEGSIGKQSVKKSASKTVDIKGDRYPEIPMGSWVGQRFIFLPADKSQRDSHYEDFTIIGGSNEPIKYQDYVGRVARVISIETEDSSISRVIFEMEDDKQKMSAKPSYGSINDIALLSDIENARKKWKGKTIWTKQGVDLKKYDAGTDEVEHMKPELFSPLKVTDVVAGWYSSYPVRLILRTQTGNIYFEDISLSGTNSSATATFDTYFSETDLRKKYGWSKKICSAISKEEVFVGMTKTQARMSWGEPQDINRTTTGYIVHEQWVYGSGSYLYFDNEILTAIQN